jgi:hypothetical protein
MMFKRKTPSERTRERIEGEYQRQQLADEYRSVTSSGDAGREVETAVARPPCEIHNPDFSPEPGPQGQIRPPVGLCPQCRVEATQRRRYTGSTSIEVRNPRQSAFDYGMDPERVARALEAYDERQSARPNYAVPGSIEESRALDLIADLRDQERDAQKRKSGRVVIERIEGCAIVHYVVPRRGRGLVRRAL